MDSVNSWRGMLDGDLVRLMGRRPPHDPGARRAASRARAHLFGRGEADCRVGDDADSVIEDSLPLADNAERDGLMRSKPPPDPGAIRAADRVREQLFPQLPRPERVGDATLRFAIKEQLGHGGMGTVHLADDTELGRNVALKILRRGPGADLLRIRENARDEAKALASFSHPNIVQVYDVVRLGEQDAIVMEYVPGVSLESWLKQERRDYREIVEVFRDAGAGLAAIHDKGYVHRDFKSANVLLGDASGPHRVKVTDLGLAALIKDLLERATSTESPRRQVVGTIRYMSPEHFDALATPKSDQFSFCVSLYYALYGVSPFEPSPSRAVTEELDGGRLRTMERVAPASEIDEGYAILRGVLRPPPRGVRAPRWLQRVIARGLSKNPEDRFPTMEALVAALENPWKKRAMPIALSTASVAVLGAGVAGYLAYSHDPCQGAGDGIAEYWNDARRSSVTAAFVATGLPFADATAARVIESLDRYADSWSGAYRDACETTRVRAEHDAEVMARRYDCLDRQAEELESYVSSLSGGGGATVVNSIPALASLPEVSSCATALILERTCDLSGDKMSEERFADFTSSLRAGRSAELRGVMIEAVEHTERAVALAAEYGGPALEAKAKVQLGDLLREGQFWRSLAAYDQAYQLAERASCDALASRAVGGAVRLTALYSPISRAKGDAWSSVQESKADRVGSSLLRADALRFRGLMRSLRPRRGDSSRARAQQDFSQALELLDAEPSLPPGRELDRAFLTLNLGTVLESRGQRDEGLEAITRSLEQFDAALGPEHPYLHVPLGNLAEALLPTRKDEALEYGRRALAMAELAGEPTAAIARENLRMSELLRANGDAGGALRHALEAQRVYEIVAGEGALPEPAYAAAVGQASLHRGELEQAIMAFERAVEIYAQIDRDGAPKLSYALAHARLANALQGVERLDEARRHAARGVELIATSDEEPLNWRRGEIALAFGDVLVNRGELREAKAPLERATRILAADEDNGELLAWARWGLARSVCEGFGDGERGRTLAARARTWFVDNEQPEAEVIARWLESTCAQAPA